MQTKTIQRTITTMLALLLLAIVGGYIYYGMWLAKQNDSTPVIPLPSATTTGAKKDPLTPEKKMEILKLLNNSSPATNTTSIVDQKKILESLSASASGTTTPLSEAEKQKILEHLQSN